MAKEDGETARMMRDEKPPRNAASASAHQTRPPDSLHKLIFSRCHPSLSSLFCVQCCCSISHIHHDAAVNPRIFSSSSPILQIFSLPASPIEVHSGCEAQAVRKTPSVELHPHHPTMAPRTVIISCMLHCSSRIKYRSQPVAGMLRLNASEGLADSEQRYKCSICAWIQCGPPSSSICPILAHYQAH
ncbi:hypothetical protein BJX70DRAFT_7331 [Aspergillus crustosus]